MNPPNPPKPPLHTNPHRLYRNTQKKVLAGVCAGIADYGGFDRGLVRLVFIILLILSLPVTLAGYVILAIVLPTAPDKIYATQDEEQFWRSVSKKPTHTLGNLRHRLRSLDKRIQKMERWVTSSSYQFDKKLNDQN